MLAYLLPGLFFILATSYLVVICRRHARRFDSALWLKAMQLLGWIFFLTLLFHFFFGSSWEWAEESNQAGAHFWAVVFYIICSTLVFHGIWKLYRSSRIRFSHRRPSGWAER